MYKLIGKSKPSGSVPVIKDCTEMRLILFPPLPFPPPPHPNTHTHAIFLAYGPVAFTINMC